MNYSKTSSSDSVILVPNGYGKLAYVDELERQLGQFIDTKTVDIDGTANVGGILRIDQVTNSIQKLVEEQVKPNDKATIISHCSALIALTNIDKSNVFWERIEQIIVYSYLAEPAEHLARFRSKASSLGVNISPSIEAELSEYSSKAIAKIPRPIHILHPKTQANQIRANASQLEDIRQFENVASLVQPDSGYEIRDESQVEHVSHIVNDYYKEIL